VVELTWIEGLSIIARYVHISHIATRWGRWPVTHNPRNRVLSYDPFEYVFEPEGERWRGLRGGVLRDLGAIRGHCAACGAPATDDHIIALDDEYSPGDDDPLNFMPLCRGHNASKGNRDLLEWTLRKFGGPFWIRLASADPVRVEAGGYWYPEGDGSRRYVGRSVLRIYLHNRYRYLKARGGLRAPAPRFLADYVAAMERELRVPEELADVVHGLSSAEAVT
jgi:hypothetical protein